MGLFGSKNITAVDAGTGSLKVVQIKHGAKPEVVAAEIVEFPPESGAESLGANLRYLLSEKNIPFRNVITQMPGKDLTIRSLSLPKMPLKELREAVRWEAKRHISYPLDTALVEYLITGEKREGQVDKYDLLLIAAEESKVREYLAPFDEARIKVAAVDVNALALRNLLRLSMPSDGADTLVVDLGAGKTEINIFKAGHLRFSRCLETGGAEITRMVADHLGTTVKDAEAVKCGMNIAAAPDQDKTAAVIKSGLDALLMEIRRSIEYYKTTFREKNVERALLTGGTALMQGLPEYFSQSLGLPVALLDPFDVLDAGTAVNGKVSRPATRFSAAVGLALRQAPLSRSAKAEDRS